ncbi:type II secretion system F family protein [Burkholderia cenocepacia]|uniref:type II secretion system F family protein n=1 Tax=Burkholderia cenocepacia TaxID=95486 RepID=UPI00097C06C4|nr:type II secretion system F family protein [Burkholderia cenocepacia]AQQ19047.1 type II secretion system protein [Burkholderia cenocepacia]MCW3541096.1 type II secretion system F family protein [Burkholderia cenocepacia]ONJ18641.1 type II secretion system protein [Burkholderia cenocepacia]ONN80054.1 type II secretion system protein [Burkholderia cenocepacia]ONN86521.1 type II secretion system protein [Burkholderia cenocepacia]
MRTPPRETRFAWRGRHRDGSPRRGIVVAFDAAAARATLARDGIAVLSLDGRGPARPPAAAARDITRFTRQLASLLQAGLPLAPSLEMLARTRTRDGVPRIAAGLAREIVGGRRFADALARYPSQFGTLYRQLIEVGEASGSLGIVLTRVAEHRERADAQWRKLRAALAYPAAVILFAPTRALLALSSALSAWGGVLLAGAAAIALAAQHALRRSVALRHALARRLLRAPLAGSALERFAAARWCRSLATLLGAGVPLADAFATLERTAGHPVFAHATVHIAARVLRGVRLADAMHSAGCFPDDVVQPIAVAEETGALDSMLGDIAALCERQLDARLDALAALGEPLIVIVLGALVGGLVIAMYLPILQLGNVV